MSRIYRVRDAQRFVFFFLLCPLIPLLLQLLRPSWTLALLGGVGAFLAFLVISLFSQREFEVGVEYIRIDSGARAQMIFHAEIEEILLTRGNFVEFRLEGRRRRVRLAPEDCPSATAALAAFARRHEIPITDNRRKQKDRRAPA